MQTGPHALYAVEADTEQPFIQVGISLGRGGALGLEPLSRQAERLTRPERYPVAGVNGDYFFYPSRSQPGIPTNAVVLDGELIRTPFPRSCLILDPAKAPSIGILRASGQVTLPAAQRALDGVNQPRGANQLVLYTPWFGPTTRTAAEGTEIYLEPEQLPLRPGMLHRARVRAVQTGVGDAPVAAGNWILSGSGPSGQLLKALAPGDLVQLKVDFEPHSLALAPGVQVLGGGPRLVRGGRVCVEAEGGTLQDGFARSRHPRTAIGFNGRKLYLLVTDGRRPGFSSGMTLEELAQAMVALGCTDALNMDGGGSSTLWARGTIVNQPSDGRERPVANGLLVFSTAPKGDPIRLIPSPEEIHALMGAETPLAVVGEDQFYNPIPLPPDQLQWSVDSYLGTIKEGRFLAGEGPLEPGQVYAAGRIRIAAGTAAGEIPVRVHARPARVEVTPAAARLANRAHATFKVHAYDGEGHPLLLPPGVRWECSPEIGSLDAAGNFAASEAAARGTVTAIVNGVAGMAQVEVAEGAPRLLEDFETARDWKLQTTPGALGGVRIAEGTARSGKSALRLEYDFTAGSGTRAVYALGNRLLGRPLALKLWVYGDGQGAWLRLKLRDSTGTAHFLDVARKVDWKNSWRDFRIPISEDLPAPISLEAVYVVEPDPTLKPKGALLIDDLDVEQ
jgi:phosphodiester glycosidase